MKNELMKDLADFGNMTAVVCGVAEEDYGRVVFKGPMGEQLVIVANLVENMANDFKTKAGEYSGAVAGMVIVNALKLALGEKLLGEAIKGSKSKHEEAKLMLKSMAELDKKVVSENA